MLNHYSNRAYELNMEDNKRKPTSIKHIICGQVFGIIVFALGFAAGLCVGIFLFHGPKQTQDHYQGLQNTISMTDGQNIYKPTTPIIRRGFETSTSSYGDHIETKQNVPTKISKPRIPEMEENEIRLTESCNRCVWHNPIHPSSERNLFAPLSADEMILVYNTLLRHGITDVAYGQSISFKSNFVGTMFLHPPKKNEALQFLDFKGEFPGRHATVVVIRGNIEQKDYMQYKVGPLNGNPAEVKVSKLMTDGEVPYEHRPYDNVEIGEIILFVLKDLHKMIDLLKHSFGVNDVYEDITIMPNGPYNDGSGRVSRFTLGLRGLGNKEFDFLNILPFTGRLYHGGQNKSDWYTYDYFYLNQGPFSNVTEILDSYFDGTLEYVRYPEGYKEHMIQETLPVRNVYSHIRPNSQFPGTGTYEPHGPRYTITGHAVNWLGWEFTVFTSQHRGPAVFDVRFKGERIVYENSLNEIALVYSADGNGQDNMVFLDSIYGLGEAKRAIPGVDCPEYASYLNSTGWDPNGLKPVILPTFCIFEVNAQEPLWRHKGADVEGGLNNNYLVARYPAQVGNYDYVIDFQFYLDGRIQTKVSATGFIQGSFWKPSSNVKTPFGYRVASTLIGPIHDHVFGFKVDIDVAGKENDFEIIHWKSRNVTIAKNKESENVTKHPNYFFYNHTRFIEWEKLEQEIGLKIDGENQKYWTVINKNKQNRNGVDRGYRIIPMVTSSQNLQDDYPRMRELSFTKYHCTITKQKDNEQYLKPLYFPVVNKPKNESSLTQLYLEDMVDGEFIANEDLVTWLSVGFVHIPTSEDVPMTIRVESGFTLKPFNFFDTTATFDVPSLLIFNKTLYDSPPLPDSCLSNPFPITH